VYFRGHPRYDALRIEFNSANTDSTSADVEVKVDSNDEVSEVESNGFASMDATVFSESGIDASSTDETRGTEAMSRVVAVQISETEGTNTGESVEATVKLHDASDPAQNGAAFANR